MDYIYLKKLVDEGLTSTEIARKLECSSTKVRSHIYKCGFRLRLAKKSVKGVIVCLTCGEKDYTLFDVNRPNRCIKCHSKSMLERNRLLKKRYVDYLGGKCSCCGYSKNLAALDFHHLDPSTKDRKWRGIKNSHKRNIEELSKCILLCRNCHSELHFPECQTDKY